MVREPLLNGDLFCKVTVMTTGIARRDNTAAQLQVEATRWREGRVARRLLALALVLEGLPRWKAAEMCGMDR